MSRYLMMENTLKVDFSIGEGSSDFQNSLIFIKDNTSSGKTLKLHFHFYEIT